MTKMNLDLNYDIREEDKSTMVEGKDGKMVKKVIKNKDITVSQIKNAINAKYSEKGLGGQMRRTCGRLLASLNEASEGKSNEVELESAELDFLESLFKDDVKYPPAITHLINTIEDEVKRISA